MYKVVLAAFLSGVATSLLTAIFLSLEKAAELPFGSIVTGLAVGLLWVTRGIGAKSEDKVIFVAVTTMVGMLGWVVFGLFV